jgi:ribosomal protein L7Ae-like RNA K-turn-binding protein
VGAAPDLVDQVAAMLVRRCLDLVGLARRAGQLVAGFDQVADGLRQGGCALVLTARDGAADGRRRIEALARRVPVLDPFSRAELGSAVGRDEIVHLGVAAGGLVGQLLKELRRLHGFREFAMPPEHAAVSNAEDKGTAQT